MSERISTAGRLGEVDLAGALSLAADRDSPPVAVRTTVITLVAETRRLRGLIGCVVKSDIDDPTDPAMAALIDEAKAIRRER